MVVVDQIVVDERGIDWLHIPDGWIPMETVAIDKSHGVVVVEPFNSVNLKESRDSMLKKKFGDSDFSEVINSKCPHRVGSHYSGQEAPSLSSLTDELKELLALNIILKEQMRGLSNEAKYQS